MTSNNLGNIFVALCIVFLLAWLLDLPSGDVVGWVALCFTAMAGTK
jgi:hypothetical protein